MTNLANDFELVASLETRRVFIGEMFSVCAVDLLCSLEIEATEQEVPACLWSFLTGDLPTDMPEPEVVKQAAIDYWGQDWAKALRDCALASITPPDRFELVMALCCTKIEYGARFSEPLLRRFIQHQAAVTIVADDDQANLLPLVAYFGLSPEVFKKRLGKGAWKRVSNKSFDWTKTYIDEWSGASQNILRFATDKPSAIAWSDAAGVSTLSVLAYCKDPLVQHFQRAVHVGWQGEVANGVQANSIRNQLLLWLNTHVDFYPEEPIEVPIKESVWEFIALFEDTYRLSLPLGANFNPKWSPTRMRCEHDRYAKMLAEQEASAERFASLDDAVPAGFTGEHGYEFRLLDSPLALHTEAIDQDNCLASYVQRVTNEDYVVYAMRHAHLPACSLSLRPGFNQPKFELDQLEGARGGAAPKAARLDARAFIEMFNHTESELLRRVHYKAHDHDHPPI